MTTPGKRARAAVWEILDAYRNAETRVEREEVARAVALLTPNGGRTLGEMADQALEQAKREGT